MVKFSEELCKNICDGILLFDDLLLGELTAINYHWSKSSFF